MKEKIKDTLSYIQKTLGVQINATPLAKVYMDKLPMYIGETYKLFNIEFFNNEIILAQPKNEEYLSIQQTEKQVLQMKNTLNKKVVIVLENLLAFQRKRLIEKGINFIVAGKQMYLPDLLIDLKETKMQLKRSGKNEKLLPSAQFLLIYYILHHNQSWNLENFSFKEIAKKMNYTPMAITNAIDNLKFHELVEVRGEKEKFIRFRGNRVELWNKVQMQNLLVNPVIKTVFLDEMPKGIKLLKSNQSALPEYTNLNPSKQQYYAIEKTIFYELKKDKTLINPNELDGRYAIEIWKYNPFVMIEDLPISLNVVDPLSLFLSVKDIRDERVEGELEQLVKKNVW
jgi:DNA-binding MarR family transcriptional regulator